MNDRMQVRMMVAIAATAGFFLAMPVAQASCLDEDATGRFHVADAAGRYEFECVDALPIVSPDGLPESCRGRGAAGSIALTPGTTIVCNPGVDAWCSNAPFPFRIAVGTDQPDDVVVPDDLPTAFFGGPMNDTFSGGAGGDFAHGAAGKDDLSGEGGRDYLCPGRCANCGVTPQGPQYELIEGGPGRDILIGGPGPDEIHGGPGDDILNGGGGDDFVYGEAGDDVVFGGVDDDVLEGGIGDDWLHGSAGVDTLSGGAGDDVLMSRDTEADVLDGGGDPQDECIHDASDASVVGCIASVPLACAVSPTLYANDAPLDLALLDAQSGTLLAPALPIGFPGLPPGRALDSVSGLAVHPDDCTDLWGVLRDDVGDQYLVQIDPGTALAFPPPSGIAAITGPASPIVDTAFHPTGRLFGLDQDARLVEIDTATAATAVAVDDWTTNGGVAPPREPVHLAYDDTDTGFFLVMTEDPAEQDYHLDILMPQGFASWLTDSRSAPSMTYDGEAFTVRVATPDHLAGHLQRIDDAGDMWLHVRKYFEAKHGPISTSVYDPAYLTAPHWD